MNWFDTSGLTSLAKTALKEAQKTLDKALDIQDDDEEQEPQPAPPPEDQPSSPGTSRAPQRDSSDFFSSWGLTVSAESAHDGAAPDRPVVTESPSKATATAQSVWGSFAGSFFEQPTGDEAPAAGAVVRPPKAKSMNVIAGAYGSQDDLFSKSQLVMSNADFTATKDSKGDDRRGSSRSNQLSLVSSRNSSDSVEVLSHSMKTTPDSEASVQTMSHSSSCGQKINSESVEILPDSLISPSSIECLGFDSCSEKNSSSSSNLSPSTSDNKSNPMVEKTEKILSADSVSLVPDDDEDTMSYNSISECTAPTVLDTDDNVTSPFSKVVRTEPQRKCVEKELVHLEPTLLPHKMQLSENSSDGGSWSDRTLNPDSDSINLEATEDHKKELDQEDTLMEKLSDSSSFYNVNVSSNEMIRSESSAFVDVDRHQCQDGSEMSQKDGSGKERVSPISSDSKSESLVKIGSDRTSGHTSGDDLETATSSDIEIIPSPNGDNGQSFRSSPAKYAFKQSKLDGTTSPSLVDLVLGRSLASKIRGHNRELSEASVQSAASDDSQGSDTERLLRRLSEMAEVLEARENRLMEVSRSNAELAESNAELRSQVEGFAARGGQEGDAAQLAEDYSQRMSALEKQFQLAIREKDQLRKQLDSMKADCSSRKNSSELENVLKEKDDVIAQLQEEGEKLARQQLQHSNIIKKLRAKEKDNEQVIKSLRDKISELTAEGDRARRSLAAKEEAEVAQLEAHYRLTTANKRLEADLAESKSALEDATQRLESTRVSLEAARKELADLQRTSSELQRRRGAQARIESERDRLEGECERLRDEVALLRTEMVHEQKRWASREESLRRELSAAREAAAAAEAVATAGATGGGLAGGDGGGAGGLLAQLAALQRAALHTDQAHKANTARLHHHIAEAETSLAKAVERERLTKEENQALHERLGAAEALLGAAQDQLQAAAAQHHAALTRANTAEELLATKSRALERLKEGVKGMEARVSQLTARVSETETLLEAAQKVVEAERQRNAILQEQLCVRGGDVSPPHSLSDSMSVGGSLWAPEEGPSLCMEETLTLMTLLKRREGEARAAAAQATQLRAERDAVRKRLAALQGELDDLRCVQEQYDALLQMYGEKEEQLQEVRLDLADVTALYKQQLDELVALRQAASNART